jgi:hypothetical protein
MTPTYRPFPQRVFKSEKIFVKFAEALLQFLSRSCITSLGLMTNGCLL